MAPSVDPASPPLANGREETEQQEEQKERASSPVRRQPSPPIPSPSPQQPAPPTPPEAEAAAAASAPAEPASTTTTASSTTSPPPAPASSSGTQSPGAVAFALPSAEQATSAPKSTVTLQVPTPALAVDSAAASQPPTPLYSPSPKGILKRRRATAPEQHQTSDDPSVYMDGKRLRFRSMGDLGPPSAPLSPRSGGRIVADRRRSSTLVSSAANEGVERTAEEEEEQDELGTLPSDPKRASKLVDINQGEELRESVERLERFCEASVEWSMSLEEQGNPAATPATARMTRKHSAVGSPTSSPRAKPAQPRPFGGMPPLPASFTAGRGSIALSPKSAASQPVMPGMPHRAQSDPHAKAAFPYTDARRQSLPEKLHSAAASLVVMACQPQSRSKSFSHGRNSISASSNVLPPLSAPPSPPRTTAAAQADGRRPSMAPKLPSFQDVVSNDGKGPAPTSHANELLDRLRRASQPAGGHAAAVAAATAITEAAGSSASTLPALPAAASNRPSAADGSGQQAPLSARNLVQTYSTVLRDRIQSWEGLENLVKDAEAVADDWEETGMHKVESAYGTPPPQSHPAYQQQQQPLMHRQQQYAYRYQNRPSA